MSTGLSSVNKILSNFNFCIFEPPQPIFDYLLGTLASFFHLFYFLIIYFFIFCICFCAGTKNGLQHLLPTVINIAILVNMLKLVSGISDLVIPLIQSRPLFSLNLRFPLLQILPSMFVPLVARVRRRNDRPPSRKNRNIYSWQIGRDKEFLSLQVKIWTGSRHLVFWLLGTLTGL